MWIIPIRLRFVLIAVLLITGIAVSFVKYGLAWSWLLLIPGIVLLVGYILFGTIASSSKLLQEGKLDEAEANLKMTFKPNWMLKMNQGTYYFLLGTIYMQRRDMATSETYMHQALAKGMPSDDFTAQVHLFLAQIAASKRKIPQAKHHMREIKQLNVKEQMVLDAIRQVETELKKIPKGGGFRQQQQQRQMRGGKGKRR